jgi:hypothetical protein
MAATAAAAAASNSAAEAYSARVSGSIGCKRSADGSIKAASSSQPAVVGAPPAPAAAGTGRGDGTPLAEASSKQQQAACPLSAGSAAIAAAASNEDGGSLLPALLRYRSQLLAAGVQISDDGQYAWGPLADILSKGVRLEATEVLGRGAFGKVERGTLNGDTNTIVCKTVHGYVLDETADIGDRAVTLLTRTGQRWLSLHGHGAVELLGLLVEADAGQVLQVQQYMQDLGPDCRDAEAAVWGPKPDASFDAAGAGSSSSSGGGKHQAVPTVDSGAVLYKSMGRLQPQVRPLQVLAEPIAWWKIHAVICSAVDALKELHTHDIIHRDVKLLNFLLACSSLVGPQQRTHPMIPAVFQLELEQACAAAQQMQEAAMPPAAEAAADASDGQQQQEGKREEDGVPDMVGAGEPAAAAAAAGGSGGPNISSDALMSATNAQVSLTYLMKVSLSLSHPASTTSVPQPVWHNMQCMPEKTHSNNFDHLVPAADCREPTIVLCLVRPLQLLVCSTTA